MKVTLYNNTSSDNTINKELINPFEIDVRFRKDFDLIRPTIKLSGINLNKYNYLKIDDLNRFYFIRNIEPINGSIANFICEVDVLETYKTNILVANSLFYRNIKDGDYNKISVEVSEKKLITRHLGDVDISGQESMIMTTIGSENV